MPTDHDQPEQFDSVGYFIQLENSAIRGETIVISPAMARRACGAWKADPNMSDTECLMRLLSCHVSDPSRIHVVRFPR